MKKLSKSQKLISFISILLVTVVIAILITTNIIKKNNQVESEGYLATTANAGSNLVARYIKKGITIGGITGTLEILDTSDATATPCDIAKGKTAYVKGEKITGTYIGTVESTLGTVTGNETKNSEVNDKYGNPVKVPAGFKVVNPEDDVTKGIIIEDVSAPGKTSDTKGSQFVWIPVGEIITDSCGSTKTITLGRYTFDSTGKETLVQSANNWSQEVAINTYYKELANSTYGNSTAKNLEDFVTKALSSGGYYIGRYEAGDATATSSARTDSSRDTNPLVCKSGVYPYNFITQPQVSNLCKEMYSSSDFESDLINSYVWDTTIVFIQKFSGDTNYSRQRRLQNTLAKCGESHSGEEYDIRCNIYDMAGNTYELSTETSSEAHGSCVYRGDSYYGAVYTSDRPRGIKPSSLFAGSSRPTLYL